jgi:tRNA pseudouridine55 synthase
VVARGDAAALGPERLAEALRAHLGWQEQVPPATSAKKVGGEPAYRKAHRGEEVELPPSRVYLHAARWLSHRLPHASTLELTCRGGYYVRALARDLGRQLGSGAHLVGLHRTAIGPWRDPGPGSAPLFVGGEALLPWLPLRRLDDAEKGLLKRGEPLPRGRVLPATWPLPPGFPAPEPHVRALHQDKLVALLRPESGQLLPEVALTGGL